MLGFIIGVFIGAALAVMIIGFLFAVSDDQPEHHAKRNEPESWRWEGWK